MNVKILYSTKENDWDEIKNVERAVNWSAINEVAVWVEGVRTVYGQERIIMQVEINGIF